MKKILLIISLCVALGQNAMSDNIVKSFKSYYSSEYQGEYALTGCFQGVSGNGKYAVGYDDGVFDFISYLWNAENPDKLEYFYYSCYMSDVADDGTVVGAALFKEGVNEGAPAYYKDGKWTFLPMHETCYGTDPGTNMAVRISPDGKYIGGIICCEHATGEQKKIYPCLWTRNDATGEYDLTVHNNINLPDHQGFILYDMSDDGRYLVGRVFTGFGSTIPAYIKDGELYLFNELTEETYIEEWDGNGDGEFTPEDPSSYDVYLETTDWYIDGVKDQAQADGQIMSVDNEGNMVGWITHLSEEASYNTGIFFNEEKNNGELVDLPHMFGCVVQGEDCIFASDGAYGDVFYMRSATDEGIEISEAFEVEKDKFSLVFEMSNDSKVLVGATVFVGEQSYNQPFLLMLENPCSGIQTITTDNGNIEISAKAGEINVAGAKDVAVYSLNGTLISKNAVVSVPAGIYIVKADGNATKVVVK